MDPSSRDYQAGFDAGWKDGRWQGRNDVWNSLLICVGDSLGSTCDKSKAQPYLQAMECFLEVEKLSMAQLKVKVDRARANIIRCKMGAKIKKLVRDHWKGRRRRRP